MKKLLAALAVAAFGLVLGAGPALADGTIPWTGNGSDNLPCDSGGHWVLAPAFGIDSATLTVDGTDYQMVQNGGGSWAADSVGPITVTTTASVTYTGAGDERDHLQLSHCVGGSPSPTTPPPTSPPPTSPPPTSPPPTSPPPPPGGGCHQTHTCNHRHGGTAPRTPPKQLAFTGLTGGQEALGIGGLALLLLGFGALRVASTERKRKALGL